MRSPIEQQLIDGKMYWDAITPQTWMRLVELPSRDVIGHYKFEYGWAPRWVATLNDFQTWQPTTREFKTAEEAREWIESSYVAKLVA